MTFILCIVALTFMVSVEAAPAQASSPIVLPEQPEPDFFTKKLKSVQGAILDTLKAGQDLQTMEGKLQDIVNHSSYFYLTESATEYAVKKDAYKNGWSADSSGAEVEDAKKPSCTSAKQCQEGGRKCSIGKLEGCTIKLSNIVGQEETCKCRNE